MFIDRRWVTYFDWGLFFLGVLLPITGLIALYSAGHDPDSSHQIFSWIPIEFKSKVFLKQLLFLFVGLAVLGLAMSVSSQTWYRYSYVLFWVCVVLLIAVHYFGTVSHGSKRWLSLGVYNLQPSEIMKLGVILGMARYISKHPPRFEVYGFSELIVPFLMFSIPMGLIVIQPDLGTALVVGAIGFSMVLFMGIRLRSLLIMAVVVVMSLVPVWTHMLHGYQKRRIKVLLNPEADPKGSGWHIRQSKIAVGSGELLGKGYLNGSQTQLEFLPERTTDFIFCVLAEETGFFGSVFVLLLYAMFIYRILRVVLRSKDLFSGLVCFGIAAMIFVHIIVNIGMVIGLLPIVGLPLPLFSYGGSSMISTMFALGIVLGMSMRRHVFS